MTTDNNNLNFSTGMYKYQCSDCGWIYDEALGFPEKGIAPGTKWEDLSEDFKCGNCSNRKKTHKWKRLS